LIIRYSVELISSIVEAVLIKQEEREKAKSAATVVISSATQTKVEHLFRVVGLHRRVYDGPAVALPSVHFLPFNWAHRDEDDGLPDARTHIENELKKFGVPIGRGGYAVEDVHSDKRLLNVSDEKIGAISGGTDIALVPYKTAKSGINQCICVMFEIKTDENVSKFADGLKHFEPQAHAELLASRCLSDQPGVLVVLTDLVSGAILYTLDYTETYEGFSVVEQIANLDEMGSMIAKFLADIAVPDVNFRPIEAHANPRDVPCIMFKKTKLSHDIGLALEQFCEMAPDTEPNSRDRVCLVEQLFRSMSDVPHIPSIVVHSMYT
jgi:hypothetical protein